MTSGASFFSISAVCVNGGKSSDAQVNIFSMPGIKRSRVGFNAPLRVSETYFSTNSKLRNKALIKALDGEWLPFLTFSRLDSI